MDDSITAVEAGLGHRFVDRELLLDALTHCSFANEKPQLARSDNDRLEFLGDALLQWAVSAILMREFPEADAGELTRRRADLVCAEGLNRLAVRVGIGPALRLGKGEERTGGREKPRLLSSAFEACIAAVYLDAGGDAVLALCERLFTSELRQVAMGEKDAKTRLQEALQRVRRKAPTYRVESVEGPDHDVSFQVAALLDGVPVATGAGRTKLEAEQRAAQAALSDLASEGD